MPSWVSLLATILGGGVLAGIIGAVLAHKFQQQRERVQEHVVRVAQRRDLCLTLLDAVNRLRDQLSTFESFHDDRAGRFFKRESLKLALQRMQAAMEPIWKVRRELDLEPDAQLQAAIDRFGDAAIAYQQAIERVLVSPWNPLKPYVGKLPQAEQSKLVQEYTESIMALQEAVRSHMARIQQSSQSPAPAPHK